MINGCRKGKEYERKIVDKLNKHFGVEFRRVPLSGGFAQKQKTNNPVFRGDIFTESEGWNTMYHTIIECKRRKRALTLLDGMLIIKGQDALELHGRTSELAKWVQQCMKESEGLDFWLVFGWHGSQDFIVHGIRHGSDYLLDGPHFFDDFINQQKRFGDIA